MKLEWPIFDGKLDKSLKPVIIKRDKIEFLWSMRYYFNLQYMSFKDFLDAEILGWNMKGIRIKDMVDYDRWIEPFRDRDPLIFEFEDMIKLEGFPHNEITRTKRKPEIPKEFIDIVNSSIY